MGVATGKPINRGEFGSCVGQMDVFCVQVYRGRLALQDQAKFGIREHFA